MSINIQIPKCTNCGLHRFRRNMVIGRGVIKADILFMGEAPGRSENTLGEAFVGRGGKLLDRIMRDASLLLHIPVPSFFITNTVLCRPTDSVNGDNRPPTEAEILACRPSIKYIISIIKPKEIVFIGRVSERYYASEYPGSIRILHPAHLLRQGGESSNYYWVTVRKLAELYERMYHAKKETLFHTDKKRSRARRRFVHSC